MTGQNCNIVFLIYFILIIHKKYCKDNHYFSLNKQSFSPQKNAPNLDDWEHFTIIRKNYFFWDSSTATATETVIPTMGLLPAPRKPIISTSKSTFGGFCIGAQQVLKQ